MKTVTLKKQTKLTPKQQALKDMRKTGEKTAIVGLVQQKSVRDTLTFFELPYSSY